MASRARATIASIAMLLPLPFVPAFAQAEGGGGNMSYLSGIYRMEHAPSMGGESSLAANNPRQPSTSAPSNAAARQQPASLEATNR